MAKTREEMKRMLTTVIPLRHPGTPKCGCGRDAEYEVYEDRQPHCLSHMLEAVDCQISVMVRRIEGGFDDAS